MNRARLLAGLMFLAIFATSASPEMPPGSQGTLRIQVDAEEIPRASGPVDEAGLGGASHRFEEFSGGPTGTLLIGGALLAALALVLAVVIPW